MGYIILILVIILLMVIGFVRARREQMREYNEKMDKLTMPCGELVPNDEELFAMTEEELFLWNKADLLWVINYSGHKMDSTMPNYESWRAFYERASRAKNRHHWDETPYYD